MVTRALVEDFVAQRRLAVVGVSRSGKKFGNMAYRALRGAGYRVFAVHPEAGVVEGDEAYRSLASLPEPVDGVVVIVPPDQAERVVREAAAVGIRRVWLQQGAESQAAVAACETQGIGCVHGECILMFTAHQAWFHRAHRFVRRVSGRMPA